MLNFPDSTAHEFCTVHTANCEERTGIVTVTEPPALGGLVRHHRRRLKKGKRTGCSLFGSRLVADLEWLRSLSSPSCTPKNGISVAFIFFFSEVAYLNDFFASHRTSVVHCHNDVEVLRLTDRRRRECQAGAAIDFGRLCPTLTGPHRLTNWRCCIRSQFNTSIRDSGQTYV